MKTKSIFLKKPRVSWTKTAWKSLPVSPSDCDDKSEIHVEPRNLKASAHTCKAGKERGQRVRKSWGRGTRIIRHDPKCDKFYGE